VYVSGSGAFTKSGGTIYGSNASGTSLQNAADHDRCGHAVYAATSPAKIRDTTADSSVTLDSSVTGASGNWENASGISNITYGSVLGGTWTSQSDGSRKSPAVGHGGVAKTRVSFKSAAGAFITIQLTVSSEAGCDYAFISQLDNASATYQSGYYAGSLISGSTSVTVTIPVPTAGNHFIEIGYRKDGSLSSGSDCAWFMIVE
jgi:hypothetical protein